jgi:hypothetical protein
MSASTPRSTCCMTSVAVKSFDTEPARKTVRGVIATPFFKSAKPNAAEAVRPSGVSTATWRPGAPSSSAMRRKSSSRDAGRAESPDAAGDAGAESHGAIEAKMVSASRRAAPEARSRRVAVGEFESRIRVVESFGKSRQRPQPPGHKDDRCGTLSPHRILRIRFCMCGCGRNLTR